jgi:integrase
MIRCHLTKTLKQDPQKDPQFAPVARIVETIAAGFDSKKTASNFATYTRHAARVLAELAAKTRRSYLEILARPEEIHALFATEEELETSQKLGRRHREKCNARKRSASSRNQFLWWLRLVVERLAIEELLDPKVEDRLKLIKKVAPRERDRVQPSAGQIRELIKTVKEANPLLALFIEFLAVTGLRIGGALSLRWDRIDSDLNLMREVETKGRCITVPMLGESKQILLGLKSANPFRKRQGTQRCWPLGSCLRKQVNILLKSGPGECTHAHALRHWFTQAAKRAGMPIPTIALILGHRDGGKTLLGYYSHEEAEQISKDWGHLRLLEDSKVKPSGPAGVDISPEILKALLEAVAKLSNGDRVA